MVDIYIDPDIPCPGAKTTAALCIEGPIKYALKKERKKEIKKERKLGDCWIVEHVVPHIVKIHKDKKAVGTLGKALLWACFDAEA